MIISFNILFCSRGKWFDEPKYFVSHGKLHDLLEVCERCSSQADVQISDKRGAYVKFMALCSNSSCGHCRLWETSDIHGQKSTMNIMLCALVLFSGQLPAKVLRAFTFLNVIVPSVRTFFRYQKDYLHGVSIHFILPYN